jgi:hypothetical protein
MRLEAADKGAKQEWVMPRIALICTAAAAIVTAGAFAPPGAKAMPVTTPTALGAALTESTLAKKVAYACRPVWRCGYYGCGWRQACGWAPGYYAYGYDRPYRPYAAWRWRHRHW